MGVVRVKGTNPYVELEDANTAKKARIQNVGGKITITDPDTGAALLTIRAMLTQIEAKAGLAADTTGVKASSPRARLRANNLKRLVVRASITAIPADATVRVEVYDATQATVLGYVEAAGATIADAEAEITAGWADNDLVELRVNVITASATAGATFDLGYAILEAEYDTA